MNQTKNKYNHDQILKNESKSKIHGRMLSLGLHWGLRVQTRLAEILYADVGEEHQQNKQNHREIYPGELRHSGMCNPIKINIS